MKKGEAEGLKVVKGEGRKNLGTLQVLGFQNLRLRTLDWNGRELVLWIQTAVD